MFFCLEVTKIVEVCVLKYLSNIHRWTTELLLFHDISEHQIVHLHCRKYHLLKLVLEACLVVSLSCVWSMIFRNIRLFILIAEKYHFLMFVSEVVSLSCIWSMIFRNVRLFILIAEKYHLLMLVSEVVSLSCIWSMLFRTVGLFILIAENIIFIKTVPHTIGQV